MQGSMDSDSSDDDQQDDIMSVQSGTAALPVPSSKVAAYMACGESVGGGVVGETQDPMQVVTPKPKSKKRAADDMDCEEVSTSGSKKKVSCFPKIISKTSICNNMRKKCIHPRMVNA